MKKQNKRWLLKAVSVLLSVVLVCQTNLSVFSFEQGKEQSIISDYLIYTKGEKDLLINENSATVNGSIYSDAGVIFTGNDNCIASTINAKEDISENIIYEKNEHVVEIPDYTQLLENEVLYSTCYEDNTIITEDKWNLDNSISVNGNLTLDGTTFEDAGYIMAEKNIQYDAKDSSDDYSLFLYSKEGNITIQGTTLTLNGIIYAPKGKVEINAKNVVINGLIISDTLEFNGTSITINPLQDKTLLDYKPDIEIKSSGIHKENRKLTLDISESKAIEKIIPEKTIWEIVPEFEAKEGTVFIDDEISTYLTKHLIIKQAGTYKVNVTVSTAKSEYIFSKTLEISEDIAPVADFYIAEDTVFRNASDGNAIITAEDISYSADGDYIQNREWSVKFDSDNDNDFTDEEIIYTNSENLNRLEYSTSQVGKYLVELTVTEKFDDTIERFITSSDYRSANTETKQADKKVIVVENNAPEVDATATKSKNIDLVFTVGTSDTEKINAYTEKINLIKEDLENKGFNVNLSSVTTSTLTAQDTFAWTEYDHYNYTDRYLPTLDKHIIYEDSSIKMLGYSWAPLRDFLFVDDNTSSQKIFTFDMQRDRTDWHSMEGGGFLFNTSIIDGRLTGYCILLTQQGFKLIQLTDLDVESFRNGSNHTIQQAGKVISTAPVSNVYDNHSIKIVADSKTISVWDNGTALIENFELPQTETGNGYGPITCHSNHSCRQQSYFTFDNIKMETVSGNNLSDVVKDYSWRSDSSRYVINLSDTVVYDINTDELLANVAQSILENDIKFIGLGNGESIEQYNSLLNSVEGITADNTNTDIASEAVRNYIVSDTELKDFSVGDTVTTDETFVMSSGYKDIENDPIYKEQWIYKYNPALFESGEDAESEFESETPLTQFTNTGEYTIRVRAKDNPVGENDSLDSFRKWSDTSELEKSIVVHTRPIAVLQAEIYQNKVDTSKCAVKISQSSYDSDHLSAENKGIKEYIYQWKNINDAYWTEGIIPESVQVGETYLQMLTVKDEEDTLSRPAVAVISAQKVQQDFVDNEKPSVTLNLSSEKLNLGENLAISASAIDNVCIDSFTVTLDDKEILNMAGTYMLICDKEGTFIVQATAIDIFGNAETVTKQFTVEDNTDRNVPTIEITSPVNGSTTPNPVMNIEGSIYDDIELDYYKIDYKLKDNTEYITAKYSTSPINNGLLGTLNIEVVNGNVYEILITAKDKAGNVSYVTIEYKISIEEPSTEPPTEAPTQIPTQAPTEAPTQLPTQKPTETPTEAPTIANIAPTITINANKTKASVGEKVEVEVMASDDDGIRSINVYKNDELVMDFAGRLTFSEAEAQTVTIKVEAVDNTGLSNVKEIEILIYDDRDKTPPEVELTSPVNNSVISGIVQFKGNVSDDKAIEKYTLAYRLKGNTDFTNFAQGTADIDNGILGCLDTTILPNSVYEIKLTAYDAGGNFAEIINTYTVENSEDNPDLTDGKIELTLKISQNIANIGENVSTWVVVTNEENLADIKLYADETELVSDSNSYNFASDTPKKITVKAVAHDIKGREYIQTVKCAFYDKSDTIPPEVSLVYDKNDFVINTPTDLIGTVKDDKGIVEYRLWYCVDGDSTEITIANGNEQRIKEVLGTLDTTILANDVYNVYLSATDFGGNIKSCSVKYVVEGNLKVGNMSLSFEDINANLSGVNLSVLRQYSNQSKTKGDFGVGWSLGMQSAKVTLTESLGKGYTQQVEAGGFFGVYKLVETVPHYVVVSYGDGTSDRFKLKLANNTSVLTPVYAATLSFECVTNPDIKLEVIEKTFDVYGITGDIDLSPLYDPKSFILTTQDNAKIYLNADSGISKIEDANGNTITVTKNGYEHSDGKGVTFTRDSEGRIVTASDPNGNITSYSYDKNGDLVTVTNPMSNSVTFEYDKNHNLTNIKDPYGIAVARNEYDENGRLTATIDAQGNRIEYTHDVEGRTEIVKDRMGNSTVYVYDDNGNVLKETDALGNVTQKTYDEYNNVLTQTDALGNTTTYEYDGNKLVSVTDALGNKTKNVYNQSNRLQSITKLDVTSLIIDYDENGNIATTTDAEGNKIDYSYTSTGKLSGVSDEIGTYLSVSYYDDGSIKSTTDGEGNQTIYTYDENGNCNSKTTTIVKGEATQNVTETFVYDTLGNMTEAVDALGNVTKCEYNKNGKLTATQDEKGRRTSYNYDTLGNLTQITYCDNTTETYTYDANGNNTSLTDRNGNTTTFSLDANGNILSLKSSTGAVTKYTYNALGAVATMTTATGAVTKYEYDALGRNTSVTNALDEKIKYTYDENSNLKSMTDAKGNAYTYEYDLNGNRTKTIYPDGHTETSEYDARNRVVKTTNGNGVTTKYAYDLCDRLTSVTDGANSTWKYEYDEAGNLTKITDANGNITSYEYDSLGRKTKTINAEGEYETYTYYSTGNVKTYIDYKGIKTEFVYDKNDNLISKTTDEKTINYTYDENNNLLNASDNAENISYKYDSFGRITEKSLSDGVYLKYTYDSYGQIIKISTPYGDTSYEYDLLSRVTRVIDRNGQATTYEYDANGNRSALKYANGVTVTYTYDACNRLVEQKTVDDKSHIIAHYVYTLGNNGEILKITEEGKTTEYTYDSVNRLTQEKITESGTTTTTDYKYDKVSNLLSKNENGTKTSYSYNNLNQLVKETTNGVTTTYTYDKNGSLVLKSSASNTSKYVWDEDNRLSKVTVTKNSVTSTEEYLYDYQGNRIQTIVNGSDVTKYLIDTTGELSQVIAEIDSDNNEKAYYTLGQELISIAKNSKISYYCYDSHGNVRALTDEDGEITDTYTYNVYGELTKRTGTTDNSYLYCAQQYSVNTGLYYLRARYMNPETGSFISRDTYSGDYNSPITLHKYLYANANPITYSDPSGYMAAVAGTLTATSIMAESRAQHDSVILSIGMRLIAKAKAIVTLMSLTIVPGTFFVSCIVGDVLSGVAQGDVEANDSASTVRDEIISNAIDDAISFAVNYAASVATAAVIAASKAKLNKQSKDYYVYLGIDNGRPIYVGITNNVPRREAEHGSRFSDGLDQLNIVPLTRNQARAVEQVIIERNPFFSDIINNPKGNKINSISKFNILYVAAIPYGIAFVNTNLRYQYYKRLGYVN